jgi:transposase InsO family protein
MSISTESSIPDKALWRYGVISPLLHQDPNGLTQGQVLASLAGRTFVEPDGGHVKVSEETLRKWLYRYRAGGLAGLSDKKRCDSGASDVPEALQDAMFDLRKTHPRWPLSRLFEELSSSGLWNKRTPARSTLYRFAKARGLERSRAHSCAETFRSFSFTGFGQMWMADFMHGPKLRFGKRRKKTLLHVIIDDCSRYVVAGRFYTRETVEVLITEMMRAMTCFGVPERFYTDNGPCYASRHLKVVCARLGVDLLHTPPYRPQGRGKVERFFRTVRDGFLADCPHKSLDDLNAGFVRWLARYHEAVHSSLDRSPLQQRLQVKNACRALPEVARIDDLFRMHRRCRVYKNGVIHLKKRVFEVPGRAPNSRVDVYFLPWDLDEVYYGAEMKPAVFLDVVGNARRFDHPK